MTTSPQSSDLPALDPERCAALRRQYEQLVAISPSEDVTREIGDSGAGFIRASLGDAGIDDATIGLVALAVGHYLDVHINEWKKRPGSAEETQGGVAALLNAAYGVTATGLGLTEPHWRSDAVPEAGDTPPA